MRMSMEIFSIPAGARDDLRHAVHEAYERYFQRDGSRPQTVIKVQEGTCPFTGAGYLHIVVDGLDAVQLRDLNAFFAFVYSRHPGRNEAVVKDNAYLKVEEGPGTAPAAGAAEEEEDRDLSCWVCGRMDGEECTDPEQEENFTVEVRYSEDARVPLCSVCLHLLLDHDSWHAEDPGS